MKRATLTAFSILLVACCSCSKKPEEPREAEPRATEKLSKADPRSVESSPAPSKAEVAKKARPPAEKREKSVEAHEQAKIEAGQNEPKKELKGVPSDDHEEPLTDKEIQETLRKHGMTEEQRKESKRKYLKILMDSKDDIVAALKDPDPKKRLLSLSAIEEMRLKDALPQICELAREDLDERVRGKAISVAVALGAEEEVLPLLLEAVKSKEEEKRKGAAWVLVRLKRPEGIEGLVSLLDSENVVTARQAYYSIQRATGKKFGVFYRRRKGPGIPVSVIDPEKMKECFARCKEWWREEGGGFQFPAK